MTDATDPLRAIVEAIRRGKASWMLTAASGEALLAAGSVKAVKVNGGFIVALGLDRAELQKLRDAADEALVLLDRESGPN